MHFAPSDPLGRALDEAIAGRAGPLYALLERGSRLPGTRANDALGEAFAVACRARGQKGDALALRMARLTADEAPGATALEFLPVCGVLAIGARAASDPTAPTAPAARAALVAELHAHADDLRFRVRDAVVDALVRVGASVGDALVSDVASWMDGYFHAAAVLTALSREGWLTTLHKPEGPVARLDEAFALAKNAPRAAARYPGRKALVEVLARAPVALAVRFGVPVFDMLVGWGAVADPDLRELVRTIVDEKRLASRFAPDVARVRARLKATEPPVRNPDHDKGPSRDRSGDRRRAKR